MGKIGRTKKRKTSQPKRVRYNAEKRGLRRKLIDLDAHIITNPFDLQAIAARPNVSKLEVKHKRRRVKKMVHKHYLGYGR